MKSFQHRLSNFRRIGEKRREYGWKCSLVVVLVVGGWSSVCVWGESCIAMDKKPTITALHLAMRTGMEMVRRRRRGGGGEKASTLKYIISWISSISQFRKGKR